MKWLKVTTGRIPRSLPTGDHAPVVIESRMRPLPFCRLDTAPFHRESVGGEPEVRDEVEVFGPTVPAVAGIAARLDATRAGRVLEVPPVVVHVAALDLVSGCRGPPDEALWKLCRRHGRHGSEVLNPAFGRVRVRLRR